MSTQCPDCLENIDPAAGHLCEEWDSEDSNRYQSEAAGDDRLC
jgi:hypothetical protein